MWPDQGWICMQLARGTFLAFSAWSCSRPQHTLEPDQTQQEAFLAATTGTG